jgi:transposase
MALFVKLPTPEQRRRLEKLQRGAREPDVIRRANIVLLSAKRKRVHEISSEVGLHPINVRKWIHRFNDQGVEGLFPRRSPGRPKVFDELQRRRIVELATTSPDKIGLEFSSWSLQRLRSQLIEDGTLGHISAETIRQELLRNGLVFDGRCWVRMND